MKKLVCLVGLILGNLCFAQQNEEFVKVKEFYDYKKEQVSNRMKVHFDQETNLIKKAEIQNAFYKFMQKVDSIQNRDYIYALIITKNKEDLGEVFPQNKENPPSPMQHNLSSTKLKISDKAPEYPGGINELRQEVARNIYLKGIRKGVKRASANVHFIVDRDGEIKNVKAVGEDVGFNTQAEIAVYLLSNKFSPAYSNGKRVKYKFRIPLTMNFD